MGRNKELLMELKEYQDRLDRMEARTKVAHSAMIAAVGSDSAESPPGHPGFVVHHELEFSDHTLIRVDGPGSETAASTIWFSLGGEDRIFVNVAPQHVAAWEAYLEALAVAIDDQWGLSILDPDAYLEPCWVAGLVEEWHAHREGRRQRR